jgi:hypothetical protein
MWGGGGGCGLSADEYSCAHKAKINFGHLTQNVTYKGCTVRGRIRDRGLLRNEGRERIRDRGLVRDEGTERMKGPRTVKRWCNRNDKGLRI